MSAQLLVAILDNKSHAYLPIQQEPSIVNATRNLNIACKNPNIQLGHFPGDFDLYQLGEIDTITGVITPICPPKFIISAVSVCQTTSEVSHGIRD